MGHTLDPASSLDDELASRFSDIFSEKIIRIRREIDVSVVNQEFSVDFPLRFTRSFTFHFRSVTEADVLRYIRETRKTCCSLDPINVSKLGEAYESTAPAVGAIINLSFDEGHFVATEKRGLIWPYFKKIGLDINDLSNNRPVTNLTHLSKIMERAMLDQLAPFLEEVGVPVVPCYQSAYRKLHSTEAASCKIHDDLVSNTCHGKASILVLLDFSRIRRNLSIHIARFSARESPRAYINTPKKSPFFAGSWHFASGDASASATAHAPASHMFISLSARVATRCVDISSHFISSLLAYSLTLFINFCFCNSLILSCSSCA